MTLEEISNKILDGSLDNGQSEIKMEDGINEDPPSEEDSLTHHGILGMKWGVRRTPEQLGHRRKKRRETDAEYNARLKREEKERKAKAEAKAKERQIKEDSRNDLRQRRLVLKSQLKAYKQDLKYNEKLEQARLKSEERIRKANQKIKDKEEQEVADKQAKEKRNQEKQQQREQAKKDAVQTPSNIDKGILAKPTSSLSDKELNDAIIRMQKERQYKDLANKPIVKATKDVLFTVGKDIAIKQLTNIANSKINDLSSKKKNDAKETDEKSKNEKKKDNKTEDYKVDIQEAKKILDSILNEPSNKTSDSNRDDRLYDRNN